MEFVEATDTRVQSGDMTVTEFCQQVGVSVATFISGGGALKKTVVRLSVRFKRCWRYPGPILRADAQENTNDRLDRVTL